MKPEQMRVYQLMIELAAEVDGILERLPLRVAHTAKHLGNSMNSAVFNLMEGLTAFKPAVKASAFDISRRETAEVKAALRRLVMQKAQRTNQVNKQMDQANCIIGMLTNMIKQQEERVS